MKRKTVFGAGAWMVVGLLLWACGSDTSDEHATAKHLGEGCAINSDCETPYVCVFERCHVECLSTEDCPKPQRCVKWDEGVGVCQLDEELACNADKACPGKQVCALDGKCRDFCTDVSDCLKDQLCVDSVCAEPDEVENGHLIGWDGGTGGTSGTGGLLLIWVSGFFSDIVRQEKPETHDGPAL